MKPSNLIGRRVDVIDNDSVYYGHWGFIVAYDGLYHVSGGSIATHYGETTPVFDRDQIRVKRR